MQEEIDIGDFDEEEAAAKAHDVVAVQQHGRAASTNYPLEAYSIEELDKSKTTLRDTLHNMGQLRTLAARRQSR